MKPSTAAAGAIMLVLILGSFVIYYAGKSEGKDDVIERTLDSEGSTQAAANTGIFGTSAQTGSTANPGTLGAGSAPSPVPQTSGDPIFDVNLPADAQVPGGTGGPVEDSSDGVERPISFCGGTYYSTQAVVNGVDAVARIAYIATVQDGMRSVASRFCPALRERFPAGARLRPVLTSGTMSDPAFGGQARQVYVLGFVETFVIDPSSGKIYLKDDVSGRLAGEYGTLR